MDFLASILPMPPWSGPPFPQGMQIYWPWVQSSTSTAQSDLPSTPVVKDISPSVAYQENLPAYENEERISFPDGFDDESGMPRSIVVHRRYKVRSIDG